MSNARLAKVDNEVKDIGVNPADAYIFLQKLTGEDDPVVTFQTYDDQKRNRVTPQHFSGTLTKCQQTLTAENQKGAGIFVMVNAGDLNGRSEENVTAIRAAFLDLDGSPLDPVLQWELKPHLITQTSPGPDDKPRYQCFWLVKEFPLDKGLFGVVQCALCEKFSGDPHITKDLNRVMRVPGFYHNKRDPFLCELVDRTTSHPPYSAQQILAALGVDLENRGKADLTDRKDSDQNRGTIVEGSRNCDLTSEAGKLRQVGLEFEELLAALTAINSCRCKPPLPVREVENIARSVCKYPPGKAPKESKVVMPVGISFSDLHDMDLPPPRWIINEFLPEGLTLLAGAPKIRKSWLVQHLSLAVATGGLALNYYECEPGDVLHLALEDNPRRFQDRLKLMCNGKPVPGNALFFNGWLKLNEGGLDLIQKSLLDNPNIRLVIIDTLARVKPPQGKGSTSYDSDYGDLAELQRLAGQHETAIVLVHHTRKAEAHDVMDEISGTRGLSGCADSLFVLKTEHRENLDAILHFTGRDLDAGTIALKFDKERGLWLHVGDAADVKLTQGRRDVRNALIEAQKPLSIGDIKEYTRKSYDNVSKTVQRMLAKGELEKAARGRYQLPPEDVLYSPSSGSGYQGPRGSHDHA